MSDGPRAIARSVAGPRCVHAALALSAVPALQPRSTRSCPRRADDRFAGLQWRFVRIKYHHKFESGRTSSRISTASRGASTRRRRSRTCRAASRPRPRFRSRIAISLTIDDHAAVRVPVDLLRRAEQHAAAAKRAADPAGVLRCAAASR